MYTVEKCIYTIFIHSLVFSPWAGLAGTRTQSGDRYGSATLYPGQVVRGRLPLLSPHILYIQYIYTPQIHMPTSDIVVHCRTKIHRHDISNVPPRQ
jgi:hypothetical protein